MLRVVSAMDRDINYTLTYKNVKNINLRIKFDINATYKHFYPYGHTMTHKKQGSLSGNIFYVWSW